MISHGQVAYWGGPRNVWCLGMCRHWPIWGSNAATCQSEQGSTSFLAHNRSRCHFLRWSGLILLRDCCKCSSHSYSMTMWLALWSQCSSCRFCLRFQAPTTRQRPQEHLWQIMFPNPKELIWEARSQHKPPTCTCQRHVFNSNYI